MKVRPAKTCAVSAWEKIPNFLPTQTIKSPFNSMEDKIRRL